MGGFWLVVIVIAGVVLAAPGAAFGCSCGAVLGEGALDADAVDGAIVGTVTARDERTVNVRVDEVLRGELVVGQELAMRAADGGTCIGISGTVGQEAGLLLTRNDAGGWYAGLCDQVDPGVLRRLAEEGDAEDVSPVARLLARLGTLFGCDALARLVPAG